VTLPIVPSSLTLFFRASLIFAVESSRTAIDCRLMKVAKEKQSSLINPSAKVVNVFFVIDGDAK